MFRFLSSSKLSPRCQIPCVLPFTCRLFRLLSFLTFLPHCLISYQCQIYRHVFRFLSSSNLAGRLRSNPVRWTTSADLSASWSPPPPNPPPPTPRPLSHLLIDHQQTGVKIIQGWFSADIAGAANQRGKGGCNGNQTKQTCIKHT